MYLDDSPVSITSLPTPPATPDSITNSSWTITCLITLFINTLGDIAHTAIEKILIRTEQKMKLKSGVGISAFKETMNLDQLVKLLQCSVCHVVVKCVGCYCEVRVTQTVPISRN